MIQKKNYKRTKILMVMLAICISGNSSSRTIKFNI